MVPPDLKIGPRSRDLSFFYRRSSVYFTDSATLVPSVSDALNHFPRLFIRLSTIYGMMSP